jgi:inner membrane protein
LPTFIGHAVTGIALSSTISNKRQWLKIGFISVFCSIVADADAIGFRLGIPYQHWLGHRGFSHSIIFAAAVAFVVLLFFPEKSLKYRFLYFCVFFPCGLLHSIFDAMTNGGLGVAFFSPFNNNRYFFSWTPIEVSPLSIKRFLATRGLDVIRSEFFWVIVPSFFFMVMAIIYRRKNARNSGADDVKRRRKD